MRLGHSFGDHFPIDFLDKTLQDFSGANFSEAASAIGNHLLHRLSPTNRCR